MHPSRSLRLTIGQVMTLIAVLAGLLAVPRLQTPTEFKVAACVVALLPILFLTDVVVGVLFGIRCPCCSRWTLRRLAGNRSYHRCSVCGMRLKRLGFGNWLDASGPEDDAKYRGRAEARTWVGFSIPEDHGGTTTGLLLRKKRSRRRAGENA